MKRVLLLIDVSYQAYRAAAAHPLLKDSDDNFTGGLYGFWQSLAKAIRETGASDLAACLDVMPYVRSRDYPEYKLLRGTAGNEELRERQKFSLPLILESLRSVGLEPWGVPGFECDDLIGWVVRQHRHRFDHIYAQSNDSDLYQLFDVAPNFSVYATDLANVWDARRLREDLNITGAEYMLATALMGTHNDIAGIRGVGIKTAIKAVKDPALMRGYRVQYGDMIDRNLGLIKLPHPELPHLVLPSRTPASARSLYKSLGRYDIEVTANMVAAVDQIQVRKT